MQVRRVFRLQGRVEHAANVIAELHQPGDERVVPGNLAVAAGGAGFRPGRPADCLDAAKLGPKQKEIDTACEHAQIGVVQVIRRNVKSVGDPE